jgi:cardiolipin synthase
MVVDGVWATVGTTNFDNRSFALSEETNVCFHDPHLVDELRSIFCADLKKCDRIRFSGWKGRGTWQRIKEALAAVIENQV